MNSPTLFLLILLCAAKVASQSHFTGAFAKNIVNVSSIIRTIVEIESKETPNENLFLSQIIMTATDMPVDSEGSGDKAPENQPFIPLSQFRKYATDYLESVARQRATALLKVQLGEALRELRMENVRRKVSMDKFIEKIYGTPAAAKYNEYEKKTIEIEKNVIRFFTMKNTSVDIDYNISDIVEELKNQLGEDEIFDTILQNNRYNDDIFVIIFQHFRNHAIFLTVASTIKEIQDNRALLNDGDLFEEHVNTVTEVYKLMLNRMILANERREKKGFTFDNSFSAAEVSGITQTSNLPSAQNHNLFRFNWDKEEFEEKYAFLTVRRCGEFAHGYTKFSPIETHVKKEHHGCTTTLFRSDLAHAPEKDSSVLKMLLRTDAVRLMQQHYSSRIAEALSVHVAENGLFALYTTCDQSTVSDNAYTDNHTYKVVFTIEGKYMKKVENNDQYRYGWRQPEEEKRGIIQVIAYFMTPKETKC